MIVLNRIHMPGAVHMHTVVLADLKLTYMHRLDNCHAWAWALNTNFSLALIDGLRRSIVQ